MEMKIYTEIALFPWLTTRCASVPPILVLFFLFYITLVVV